MYKLFLDIETLPVEKEKHDILESLYKKDEEDGKKIKSWDEYLAGTGFDGAFGRICCISYAIDDELPVSISGDEREILVKFWEVAKDADLFIGFNLLNFDLRFIYQRSVIHGVVPSKNLNFAKYRNDPIFDVMHEWNKWDHQSHVSLHKLATALGIPSSKGGEVEGKNVAKAFEDGRIKEICEYCEKDVEVTRSIYKKLTFQG